MQTTSLPPYFSCSFTRLGNSFMHGGQLVDQASSTTTLPLCSATSLSVSSQVTILTETFDLPESVFSGAFSAVFSAAFAGLSSPASAREATQRHNEKQKHSEETMASLRGFMEYGPWEVER